MKHPREHLIHRDCYVKLSACREGYRVYVLEDLTDKQILDEFEPDFEWAWLTAKYYSVRHKIKIIDESPY